MPPDEKEEITEAIAPIVKMAQDRADNAAEVAKYIADAAIATEHGSKIELVREEIEKCRSEMELTKTALENSLTLLRAELLTLNSQLSEAVVALENRIPQPMPEQPIELIPPPSTEILVTPEAEKAPSEPDEEEKPKPRKRHRLL